MLIQYIFTVRSPYIYSDGEITLLYISSQWWVNFCHTLASIKKNNPNFHLLNVNACVNMCGQMIQLLSTALFSKVDSKILRRTKYKDIFLWKEKHHWSIMHKNECRFNLTLFCFFLLIELKSGTISCAD